MVVIVDEPVTDTKELIEALFLGSVVAVGAKVPLPIQCRSIARRLQHFGKRHLFQSHVDTFDGVHVTLRPEVDAVPLWMSASQKHCTGWATDGVSVSLSKTHTGCRELVDVRRVEVD